MDEICVFACEGAAVLCGGIQLEFAGLCVISDSSDRQCWSVISRLSHGWRFRCLQNGDMGERGVCKKDHDLLSYLWPSLRASTG